MKRYRYEHGSYAAFLEPPNDGISVPSQLKLPVGGEWIIFRLVGEEGVERTMGGVKRLSEYSYEELIYSSTGSKVFQAFFKLRELAEIVGVEPNTKDPLPDGTRSPFPHYGEEYRSKTIGELVRDINAAL